MTSAENKPDATFACVAGGAEAEVLVDPPGAAVDEEEAKTVETMVVAPIASGASCVLRP